MQSTAACIDTNMHIPELLANLTDSSILVMGGLSFRTAEIQVREKLAFTENNLPAVLRTLQAHPAVEELFLLSTCNRTELYIIGDRTADWAQLLPELIASQCRATTEEINECLYYYEDDAAAHHLFRVAAGLDSMVIGEYEIVRQIKRAVCVSREAGTTGTILQRLVEKSLAASKRARTQLRYDEYGLSVASLAVAACKRTFHDDLSALTVLVLGAGETAELTLQYLVNKGVKQVLIANRTLERAQQLACMTNGSALPLSEFPQRLPEADIVICCTSSPQALLTRDMLAPVMEQRPDTRLLIIDLAVPRDVEPEVADLHGVRLLNVDSLQNTACEIARQRQHKIQDAERIMSDEAREFGKWLASRKTIAIMKALQARIEQRRNEAIAHISEELGLTPLESARIIEPELRQLVEGILQEAISAMQHVTGADDTSYHMELARRLLDQYR